MPSTRRAASATLAAPFGDQGAGQVLRALPIGDAPVRRQLPARNQLAEVDEPELAVADHDHSGALATLEARLKVLGAT